MKKSVRQKRAKPLVERICALGHKKCQIVNGFFVHYFPRKTLYNLTILWYTNACRHKI